MNTPLRAARLARKKTLQEVAVAVSSDTGNLSRIERGEQVPSKELTDALVAYFEGEVTEMQIMWPERFVSDSSADQAVA